MLTPAICQDMVMKTSDACGCGPLDACQHPRHQRPYKMHEWMTRVQAMNNLTNKQGRVYTATVRHADVDHRVVLKHFNKPALFDHARREYVAGQHLNALNVPMFVETYASFHRNSGPYNLTRFVEGETFKSAMSKMSRQKFITLTMQMCVALEMAQSAFCFGHYDLHLENVLIHFSSKKTQILFDQYHVSFSNCFNPVIIDFGMSCGRDSVTGETWGMRQLEKKGIYDHLRPGYDMFVFFLYCHQEPGKFAFFDIVVKVLESFYKHNVDQPRQYLQTLRRGADSKTPKQLFEFLVQFSTHVIVQPRRVYTLGAIQPPPPDAVIDTYVDSVFYQQPVGDDLTPRSDAMAFRSSKSMEFKINMYYKICQTSLTSYYEKWIKIFEREVRKYWKEKDAQEARKRIKWQLPVSEIANAF